MLSSGSKLRAIEWSGGYGVWMIHVRDCPPSCNTITKIRLFGIGERTAFLDVCLFHDAVCKLRRIGRPTTADVPPFVRVFVEE